MMLYKILLGLFILMQLNVVHAQIIKTYKLKADSACSTEKSLLVISGHEIPLLSGTKADSLSLFSISQGTVHSIVLQIDQKDNQGRYILSNDPSERFASRKILGDYDELVFRKKDLGERLNSSLLLKGKLDPLPLIEIQVVDEHSDVDNKKTSGWLYLAAEGIAVNAGTINSNKQKEFLIYESARDTVISSVYKIAFSKDKPFLLDAFQWRLSGRIAGQSEWSWSPDVVDTMKIRHTGHFFGFPFKRTDDDYSSQLVAVKAGPLRIIRRTENKVKVFWKLKSPALYIDYVMMPDGFVMASMIDIPFNISIFFSHLITITTMDWNNEYKQSDLMIISQQGKLKLPVNGQPTDAKDAFNHISAKQFSVSSKLGLFEVKLAIADDFPLHSQLYLRDALDEIDKPENYPGQFGNVGFKTTGWENIDTKLHHLKFTVCVDKM